MPNYRAGPPSPEQFAEIFRGLPEYQKEAVYKACWPLLILIRHRIATRIFTVFFGVVTSGFVTTFINNYHRIHDLTADQVGAFAVAMIFLGFALGVIGAVVYYYTRNQRR